MTLNCSGQEDRAMNQTDACFYRNNKMESNCCVNDFMPYIWPFESGEKITSVTLLATFNSKIAPKGSLLGLYFRKKGGLQKYSIPLRFSTLPGIRCMYPQSVSEHHMKLERSSVTAPIYTFPLDDKYLIHVLVSWKY